MTMQEIATGSAVYHVGDTVTSTMSATHKTDYSAPLVEGLKITANGFKNLIPHVDIPNWFFPTIISLIVGYVIFFLWVNFFR